MYAKIFEQIYDGTLCTNGPWEALVTFQQLLVLADEEGCVDMTPSAISRRTTIPLEIITKGLECLVQPDPESRTPTEEGRRLVPLSEGRSWGWRVVNYKHYRQIKREHDRREYHRDYWVNKRSKKAARSTDSTPTQHAQPNQPIAEAKAEAENTSLLAQAPAFPMENRPADPPQLSLVEAVKPKVRTVPDCPHQAVLALWAEVLPAMPQHNPGMWTGTRAGHLRARWRETAVAEKWETEADGIAYLRRLFAYIGRSEFLTGRSRGGGNRPPFVAELAWVVNPQNWAKIHEGKYSTTDAA